MFQTALQLPENIVLKSSPRRKHIAIKLNWDGSGELLVPPNVSGEQIQRALRRFTPWLERKRQLLAQHNAADAPQIFKFEPGATFFFLGEKYTLYLQEQSRSGIIRLSGSQLITPSAVPLQIQSMMEDFYRRQARRLVAYHLERCCRKHNIDYRKFTINSARKRFGSCSRAGDLNFSWRLAMYPAELIELVVCHELAHRTQMNHSKAFYQILCSYLPDHRQRQQALQQWCVRLSAYP